MRPIRYNLGAVYAHHGDKVRYLLVGGWNAVFFVLVFNASLFLAGQARYLLVFWLVWVLGVVQSTISIKYLAFRSPGRLWPQIVRSYFVYLPAQVLGSVLLWLGVDIAHSSPKVVQVAVVVIQTILVYLGHKYFTFRLSRKESVFPAGSEEQIPAEVPHTATFRRRRDG